MKKMMLMAVTALMVAGCSSDENGNGTTNEAPKYITVNANISGLIHGEISAQLDSSGADDMKKRVDREIINHIDENGKRFGKDDETEETEDYMI